MEIIERGRIRRDLDVAQAVRMAGATNKEWTRWKKKLEEQSQ